MTEIHMLHIFRLIPIIPAFALCFGCQTIDVTNGATGTISVTVGDEDPPPADGEDEPLIDTSQVTRTLNEGDSASFTVNVALNVNTTEIRAQGDFVDLFDSITIAEEGPTLYIVEDNAGGIKITNNSGGAIDELWLARTSTLPDEWVLGFGDWGAPFGPINDGDILEIKPLIAADDWALKFDGTVRVAPVYNVDVAQITEITISP